MPDIGTLGGLGQALGLGFGLLLILTLRCRRYGTDVVKSYIPLWLACCIGLGVYAIVEAGLDTMTVATRLPIVAMIPALAAFLVRKLLKPSL